MELAVQEPSAYEVDLETAKQLSESKLLPEFFHKNPANTLYGMAIGRSLNVDPISALRHIHVFETKDKQGNKKVQTALSADLMATLAHNAGHIMQIVLTNQAKAEVKLIRGDSIAGKLLKGEIDLENLDKLDHLITFMEKFGVDAKKIGIFTSVWTMENAEKAGLTDKHNWTAWPREMLLARAKSSVIRMGAPEVLLGLPYTPDELGADTGQDGIPLITTIGRSEPVAAPPNSSPPKATARAARAESPDPATGDARDASSQDAAKELNPKILDWVKGNSSQEVADLASGIVGNDRGSHKEKLWQLKELCKCVAFLGKMKEEIKREGESLTLGEALMKNLASLKS